MPGLIKKQGTRSRGGQCTVPHTTFMGEEPLTVNATMTRAQQENALKDRVLAYMRQNLEYDEQGIILYQDSDPVYYDEEGPWTLDAQTVVETQTGEFKLQRYSTGSSAQLRYSPPICSCPTTSAPRPGRTQTVIAWLRSWPPC